MNTSPNSPNINSKRARQKERRRLRLEAERAAEAERKRKRLIMTWSIVGGLVVLAFVGWYFFLRDTDDTSIADSPPPLPDVSEVTGEPPDDLGENIVIPTVTTIQTANFTPFTDADYGTTPCPSEDAEFALTFDDSFQNCLTPGGEYRAIISTTSGVVTVRLDAENTPGTTNNFVSLARQNYYSSSFLFADSDSGFIYGGTRSTDITQDPGPGYTIKDEGTGFDYSFGQLAMARTDQPDSAGGAFFFTTTSTENDPPASDDYVVFGEVIGGQSVLDNIFFEQPDDQNSDQPTPPTLIQEVIILSLNYAPFSATDYGTTACPTGDAARTLDFIDSFQNCLTPGTQYTAIFRTSAGDVTIELDSVNTPGTTNNFISLARYQYYDDTLLHRTDPSIGIIQGGSPHNNAANDRGPGYTIKDEGNDFTYVPGQLVMARTGAPNSSGAQFFFTANFNANLLDSQGTYVVFGEVIEGLDVLELVLSSHAEGPNPQLGGAPNPPVTINQVEIIES